MRVIKIKHGWLQRTIKIEHEDKSVIIHYTGLTLNLGSVLVNGNCVRSQRSRIWFNSKFDFDIRGEHYSLEVRIWPWLAVRSFSLANFNGQVFLEGAVHYRISIGSEIPQLIGFIYIYI